MKHLGDITKIDWSKVEPVDCVCGGSPCQDLSVAGKRAGLAGERSGLYMEQIRCVKELREADVRRGRTGQFIRPRYMVWENVPGAFSSGKPKGADFAAVIEEIIKVVEQDAYVCVMPPDRGWSKSGCYYDSDGRWSIAWRVHDAQFWGVPQRRKRIALVADFGGLSAPEVLFERKGLSGHFEPSGAQREGTTPTTGGCAESTKCYGIGGYNSEGMKSANPHSGIYEAETSRTLDLNGGNPACNQGGIAVVEPIVYNGVSITSPINKAIPQACDPCHTLGTDSRNWLVEPMVTEPIALDRAFYNQGINAQYDPQFYEDGSCPTLVAKGPGAVSTYQNVTGPLMANSHPGSYCGQDAYQDMLIARIDCRNGRENGDLCGTLQSKPNGGFSYNCIHPVRCNNIVRRLTPLECERLQGYPDGWTDIGEWTDSKGKKRKDADSPRYKALGNSIALPFWKWMLKRISAQYERDATLGSLFDGIGGFPLCWEQINGKGTARWASEIEEFPMAVTKLRFGEE